MAQRGRKKTMRIVLDAMLTVMLVFEMFIQFTGEFLHEVIGFAFFATIVVHMILSAKWMKGAARAARDGRLRGRRRAHGVMACLLAATTAVLAVSSIAISNLLANAGFAWPLGSYALWATIHGLSSYVLCGLVVVHLAMHWAFLASAFKVPYDPSRRQAISTGVHVAAAVGAVALGIAAAQEFMPQQAAQASGSAAASGDEPDGRQQFADVPDAPYEGPTGAAVREDTAASHGVREDGAASHAGSTQETLAADESEVAEPSESVEREYEEAAEPAAAAEEVDLGICTLCRKQCSLSAPRCDRPYRAGLI